MSRHSTGMITGTAAPERETDRSAAAPAGGDATARPDRRPVAVVWADSFTDHFSPEVGVAAVEVLERAGFTVRVVGRRACCSLTWITTGQLDAARRILGRTVADLAPHARAGLPIVGVEPSCTAVLRHDVIELFAGSDLEADAFFATAGAAYDALAAAEPGRFTVIDAAAPPKTVLVEATAAVVPLLQ